jgi:stage III sporulation protein AD
MEAVLKIAAIGIVGALCAVSVKRNLPEMGFLLALAVMLFVLRFALGQMEDILDLFRELGGLSGLSSAIFSPMIKTIGIGIVTKLTADLCRDAKETGIASLVEFAGSAAALIAALPLLKTVLATMASLM